jgi:hypothetical protein
VATARKKAHRLRLKLLRKGLIRIVGSLQGDNGRPQVSVGRHCKPEAVAHEVAVCEVEVLTGWRIERGVRCGRAEPDGLVIVDGNRAYLEVDLATEDRKQWRAKTRRYGEKVDGFILVVTTSAARMERLRQWSDLIKEVALFTTFASLRSPAPEWRDWFGKSVRI